MRRCGHVGARPAGVTSPAHPSSLRSFWEHLKYAEQSSHYIGIELDPSQRLDMLQCLLAWPGLLVWPLVCQGVINVRNCNDSAGKRNTFALESGWVACPVPLFVVAGSDDLRHSQKRRAAVLEDGPARNGVCLHDSPLFVA